MVAIMMADTYLRRGKRRLQSVLENPVCLKVLFTACYVLGGFFLSAASLRSTFFPIAMGIISALSGWQAVAMTLGSMLGYRVFWGSAGIQGTVWAAGGGMLALLLGKRKKFQEDGLLPALACGAMTAGLGLFYQAVFGEHTDLTLYFLRILVAGASALLGSQLIHHRDTFADWLAGAVASLSLAQVMPIPYLSLGYVFGSAVAVTGTFPGAALAGLGLDLSRVTEIPMTAVLSLAYFLRLIPFSNRWIRYLSPIGAYLLTTLFCGIWDPVPLPGLILGCGLGVLLPQRKKWNFRRGPTGAAQVRLQLSAGVMRTMQEIYLEHSESQADLSALLEKAKIRACGRCPHRKTCKQKDQLTVKLLKNPLGVTCRKTGRLVTELQRSQEQLKVMRLQMKRRQEFRAAMIQQYGFLSRYLEFLADQLPRREEKLEPSFSVQVSARSHRKELANGDRCLAFQGVGCRYYVLLCDGMGTGLGAAEEGRNAGNLIRQMLQSGLPAPFVLQNINSVLVLRGQAGAVTVDLAELRLDTGKGTLYKWGAAPSYLIKEGRAEKLGTGGPPPGISIRDTVDPCRELSLKRGEVLVLLSDGVDGEAALQHLSWSPHIKTGDLAVEILEKGSKAREDDATAAVVRLNPACLST